MNNLYGKSEYDTVVANLKDAMFRLQEQYDDPVRFSTEKDR